MALISKIREQTQLLVVIVSLALLFFIGRELIGFNRFSFDRSPVLGVVAGQKINLATFQDQFSKLQRNFFLDYQETPSEEENVFLRNQLWKNLVHGIIYDKLCKDLGLMVTEDELVDLVQGEHIHPDLQASFIDPETKKFDKKALLGYLQNLSQLPQSNQLHWYNLERELAMSRCQTKFNQLITQSTFATGLEAQHQFNIDSTSLDLAYVYIPYHSIKDEKIDIKESMLKAYLQKHPSEYQVKEAKKIIYVTFPIVASENDKVGFDKELNLLKQDFIKTQEDSLFASIHTDTNPSLVYLKCTEQDLPAPLIQQKHSLRQRMVIGPLTESNNYYKLYKVSKVVAGNPKKYEIAVIEKTLTPSDETKEETFRKADDFISTVANKSQFEVQAAAKNLHIYDTKVEKHDTHIRSLTHARELVRWLYNEAKVGKVSPIFELSDNYVVAMVIAHIKSGIADLEEVRDKVKQQILDEEKAKIITTALQPIIDLPLSSIVTQYGDEAKLFTAQEIKFNTTKLPGIGMVNKAISQAFALEAGRRSKIIADRSGIVLLEVKQRHIPILPDSWQTNKKELAKMEKFKQASLISKALEKLASTVDYRYKYY